MKEQVTRWETVAGYVATFPADDGEGAADVEVQIGEAGGRWYVRTQDDAGGSDDADHRSYSTRDRALAAAERLAFVNDEGDGEDAAGYLHSALVARRGQPDPAGEWACYYSTVLDDSGVDERYATREAASAAVDLANEALCAANPGGNLRCAYEVRHLVDGEWLAEECES